MDIEINYNLGDMWLPVKGRIIINVHKQDDAEYLKPGDTIRHLEQEYIVKDAPVKTKCMCGSCDMGWTFSVWRDA